MKLPRVAIGVLTVFWISLIGFGLTKLDSYKTTPGPVTDTPLAWPHTSSLTRTPHASTLIVFLHPECDCSKATVDELDILLAHVPKNVKTHAVFISPKGWSEKKVKGTLWTQVSAIPGVQVSIDSQNKESTLFKAKTSGYTLLYSSQGELQFSGGITESRGHMGDNMGRNAIVEILMNQTSKVAKTKVFGCGLFEDSMLSTASTKQAN